MNLHQQQFAKQGYTVFPDALNGSLLGLLRHECAGVIAREDARLDALGVDVDGITHRGRRYFSGQCQRVQPRLRQVLFSRTMADICRVTLGNTAYFFYDQYVIKGAEQGMPLAWHQDSGYVIGNGGPADHLPYLTCWCPLDDTTVDNGTLSLLPFEQVPQSKRGVLPHLRQIGSNDLLGWVGPQAGISMEVAAGTIVAFNSLLLHSTGVNHTPSLRRVYLAQYSAEVILNPGTKQLRRDAVPFLKDGSQVTFA